MSESCFDAAWFKMLLCITLRLQTWPLHCLSLEMGTIFDTVATVLLLQVFERHCVVLKRVIIWRLREATQFNSVSFSFMIWLICLCHASSGNKTCIVTKEFWNFCRSFSCQFYRFCQFFWHFSFSVRFFCFILTFLMMHMRRHTDVFQTLGTPFHPCVNFVSWRTYVFYTQFAILQCPHLPDSSAEFKCCALCECPMLPFLWLVLQCRVSSWSCIDSAYILLCLS